MKISVTRGRKTRPDLKVGICGEHGGDPASVAFCREIGLDYVSCSPYRVPIARLAAAQAALGKTVASRAPAFSILAIREDDVMPGQKRVFALDVRHLRLTRT